MDREDPMAHLRKFYEITWSLDTSDSEEELVLVGLFLNYLVGKTKDWYLDQLDSMMTNQNTLENKLINYFYSQSKFFFLVQKRAKTQLFSKQVTWSKNCNSCFILRNNQISMWSTRLLQVNAREKPLSRIWWSNLDSYICK